jgi:hypothetical protein
MPLSTQLGSLSGYHPPVDSRRPRVGHGSATVLPTRSPLIQIDSLTIMWLLYCWTGKKPLISSPPIWLVSIPPPTPLKCLWAPWRTLSQQLSALTQPWVAPIAEVREPLEQKQTPTQKSFIRLFVLLPSYSRLRLAQVLNLASLSNTH